MLGQTRQIGELIARVRLRFPVSCNIEVATSRPWMRCSRRCVRAGSRSTLRFPPSESSHLRELALTDLHDAEHWATNMRNPVRFQQAIASAVAAQAARTLMRSRTLPTRVRRHRGRQRAPPTKSAAK